MPALGRVFTLAAGQPVGVGQAFYSAFLPGLAYFFPSIPRRPADRGCTDQSDNHFVPTDFEVTARELIGLGATRLSAKAGATAPRGAMTVG